MESSGSRRYSGKLFQMVGPATANERGIDARRVGFFTWDTFMQQSGDEISL